MTDVSREKTCFFCGFRQKTVLSQSKSNTTLLSGYSSRKEYNYIFQA